MVENDQNIPTIGQLPVDDDQRNTPHTMRKSTYCWCDKDAACRQELVIYKEKNVEFVSHYFEFLTLIDFHQLG